MHMFCYNSSLDHVSCGALFIALFQEAITMSFTKKADHTEAIFTALVWVSVINLIVLFAQEILQIVLVIEGWSCSAPADVYGQLMSPPAAVCAVANATPNVVVLFAAFLFNLFFARWAWLKREYWYREVVRGTVVNRGEYCDGEGMARYTMTVLGKNRMGEVRTQMHYVGRRGYERLLNSSIVDFRKLVEKG